MKKFKVVALIIPLVFSSCFTTVSRITKKPQKYQGRKVIVPGRVVSSLDLVDINCFTIKNKKSNIMVVTPNYLPLKKDFVLVKGVVEAQYKYSKSSILVIKEKKKKSRKPQKSKNISDKLPKDMILKEGEKGNL